MWKDGMSFECRIKKLTIHYRSSHNYGSDDSGI